MQSITILNATHREAVRPIVAVHVGIAAVEVPRVGATQPGTCRDEEEDANLIVQL